MLGLGDRLGRDCNNSLDWLKGLRGRISRISIAGGAISDIEYSGGENGFRYAPSLRSRHRPRT